MTEEIIARHLDLQEYSKTYQKMREFTEQRTDTTPDEIWFLEHPAVFTQGKAGKPEHILQKSNIPIIQTDRGGQVTYHGPGQLVVYFLIDLKRRNMHLRDLIDLIEQSLIALLTQYNISSHLIPKQPGVYVDNAKIASLGLHIRKGCSYHGLSLNVAMDLTPFSYINPCGYKALKMTQMNDFNNKLSVNNVIKKLENLVFNELQQAPTT